MPNRVPALAAAAALLLTACSIASGSDAGTAAPRSGRAEAPVLCPLSGLEAPSAAHAARPAVAVKVENSPAAYPLSGLEYAEVVYEEQVEGGMTRFMAIFHCNDTAKVGPVRSAREVDPAIMTPATRILASAGGNDIVRDVLTSSHVVLIDEDRAGAAMRRVSRPGIGLEHTLYGNTRLLRRLGAEDFDKPPPAGIFAFGEMNGPWRPARTVTVGFGLATSITYRFAGGRWWRSERGEEFLAESGNQIAVDNVVIEEHDVNNSTRIFDVAGNPSIEIADVTGSGRALVFRDGKVMAGRWVRESKSDKVTYETRAGREITLRPGSTWIELLPSDRGDVKGSFSYSAR
ncbi:MAG: DUF3048 domain-containing protein [Actinomycetota bacterium]|nr:DUF3048 domain-containing protein [Actinomycetota bacterium]